jgi:hypothetical protein
MSIAQPLLGVVEDDPPVDFESLLDVDGPDVDGPDVDGELDVDGVVDVSALFLVSLPEPEVSVLVDVPPELPSELGDSLFDAVPVFDELRLSVL